MPDPVRDVLEKIDTLRSNLSTFQRTDNAAILEDALDTLEELHDDIEEILEDFEEGSERE